ncbi:hypothetical protein J4E93_008131 [Alternaria ventricosa]|uniref:uncharacterized protein n=1 Tax=Alternaria ventricosa TaxID=1187951 RepID=UPI0020C486A3|nr:uncharacterized protein J4E93_008131 [Alternaria ventricosa]KAI4641252.1 hypothetical protein J4E93_008131 [Alternaria ventricosa]
MAIEKPINTAVVGCGQWGVKVVSAFARMNALAAVSDADVEQANKIAQDHHVPAMDWPSILEDHSITAVAIVTPAKDHANMIEQAIRAGKHVYVEKPLALSSSDAEAVAALVSRSASTFMVGHILQYHPAFLALKSRVQQGQLGRVRFIRSARFGPGRIRQDEDALWCLAPHDISMILGLTGQQPESVRAHGSSFLRAGIADTVNCRLTFADNLEAEIAVSWAHPYKHRSLVVTGDKGTLVFDDDQPWASKLRYFENTLTWKKGCPTFNQGCSEAISVEEREPLMEQIKHFVECVRTARRPITDVREGLSVINVLEAATNAMRDQTGMPTKSLAQKIPMVDLKVQQRLIKAKLDERIANVLHEGQYVWGREIKELEQKLASYTGCEHVITCSSGTDALLLALLAIGLLPGDAVLVPAFTFVATAEPIVLLGATPIFVDIDPVSLCINPDLIAKGVEAARKAGCRPVGMITVDLFGRPADYTRLHSISSDLGLWLIADGAQSFGASVAGKRVGSLACMTTTSFFPAKPLGGYGDGGAIFTSDAELAAKLRSIHQHGQGDHRYHCVRLGMNSRLDTIQAAILLEKLEVFPKELENRQIVAARYASFLKGIVRTPHPPPPETNVCHAWATYTIRLKNRAALQEHLKSVGIDSIPHYPDPLHKLAPYEKYPTIEGGCPVAEEATSEVLSIPFHPYLDENTQWLVSHAVRQFVASQTC